MPPNDSPLEAARQQLRRWQESAYFSVIAFVTALGAVAIALAWYATTPPAERTFHSKLRPSAMGSATPTTEMEPLARRAIDGRAAEPEATEPDYFAVMIDNIAEAHPESGISKAALVIEAPVEGGITRLMALFTSDSEVAKIGPVRSARPYYARWALEYGALYAHVGGSNEALDLIKSIGVRDLNEFYNGSSFWRSSDRSAPHNTYTSTELLSKAAAKRGTPKKLDSWKFKLDAPAEDRGDGQLVLEIQDYGQAGVAWTYDRDTNDFGRVIAGETEKDSDGTGIRAKNVVVQYAPVQVIDDYGRRRIQTEAGGDALIALDGRVIGGTWKKEPGGARTRFYDAVGKEMSFNAGTTWIEVVPQDTKVTY